MSLARHRRAPPPAGRTHQAEARQGPRDGLPRLASCRRSGARRSSCGFLDKGNLQLDMTKLGFDPKPLDDFQWAINQPWGMVLVTGPDRLRQDDDALLGAQRSRTRSAHNISTAEDPVEYNLHGINQVQMHDEIGLNFAMAPALLPPAGPGHHHGRRDPRLRDGGNRGQGRAHGPHGALDAAHQRRARRRSRASSTWASSRSSSRRA